MQGGRGGRDPFSDPFGGFGGFGAPRNLMSSFFGGRDPFDDPFFTRPFGGMFESSLFGPSGSPFINMHPPAILQHQPASLQHQSAFLQHQPAFLEHQPPEPKRSRGPIIEELNSDDEKEEAVKEKKENPRKHGRSSNGPFIRDPDDEVEERKSRHLQRNNDYGHYNVAQQQPQTHSFTISSSSVTTYGGADGAYYTSSKTRRTGSDGLTFEESKEADTLTRQAAHRVSKGLYNKGHSVTRKLNSDGKVDMMQTLHNLNEDQLSGFEQAWNGNARKHMPGWTGNLTGHNNMGASSSGQIEQASRGGWALPSTEQPQNSGRVMPDRNIYSTLWLIFDNAEVYGSWFDSALIGFDRS
ncbi:hypothetical protein LWI28_011789 [Acer negundo]|uniref:Myeloid leukemia factor 1 n=1 Tax=Acer negundo TaxID=4023 RepID=A0AAD5IPV6_ACENE|nr:hypothetical protein LWI28_011789 [Acer negundo]KAK4842856.1 hypothetical protein QYF36_000828 [Acer negundo]